MINRWKLTSEVKEKYTPIVREFLRELDFWIYISNNEAKSQLTEELCIRGCGMTFELNLSHIEFV